jgi:hypothetical protein
VPEDSLTHSRMYTASTRRACAHCLAFLHPTDPAGRAAHLLHTAGFSLASLSTLHRRLWFYHLVEGMSGQGFRLPPSSWPEGGEEDTLDSWYRVSCPYGTSTHSGHAPYYLDATEMRPVRGAYAAPQPASSSSSAKILIASVTVKVA